MAIVNGDGQPVDAGQLHLMTRYMAFRGPDAQEMYLDGQVGLGHTMLRTTYASVKEHQPCSLDGQVWITADARIDDHDTLRGKLEAAGRRGVQAAADSQLILHAYHVWGKQCVDHLLGDFAFAIWDGRERRLFCARDHFGIRPFYYAARGGTLLVSNTLDTLRLHPLVSDELNDLAVVNFILFGQQPKLDITTFADIQGLLPAHSLSWSDGNIELFHYWRLPVEEPELRRSDQDTIDQFVELFDTAVQDRLAPGRSGILMSGGLDSTAAAASICQLNQRDDAARSLQAYTFSYEQSFADSDPYYARTVGEYLGIGVTTIPQDDQLFCDGWNQPNFHVPEPSNAYSLVYWRGYLRQMMEQGIRVVFSGWGGDPLLYPEPTYGASLLKNGQIVSLVSQVVNYYRVCHRLPQLGIYSTIKRRLPEKSGVDQWAKAILNPDMATEITVPDRYWQLPHGEVTHPWRPVGYRLMDGPYWPVNFARYDAEISAVPIEFRYPFFDVRVARFLLRIPALRWCTQKQLLREAMSDRLPEAVLSRSKAPLEGDSAALYPEWVFEHNVPGKPLARYIDVRKVANLIPTREQPGLEPALSWRLFSLNFWLK